MKSHEKSEHLNCTVYHKRKCSENPHDRVSCCNTDSFGHRPIVNSLLGLNEKQQEKLKNIYNIDRFKCVDFISSIYGATKRELTIFQSPYISVLADDPCKHTDVSTKEQENDCPVYTTKRSPIDNISQY